VRKSPRDRTLRALEAVGPDGVRAKALGLRLRLGRATADMLALRSCRCAC
jgi:hypothetical protein